MRYIQRMSVSRRASSYLQEKSKKVAALPTVKEKKDLVKRLWPTARKTKVFRTDVFQVLLDMAGKRQRCMYCEDSRGTDVEHFWPQAPYPERVFEWLNLLLACSGCQRAKGDRFPLDDECRPLLIDPTAEDPWDYLYFAPQTGFLTPRFEAATGGECSKGRHTLDLLGPLNHEAVIEGRQAVWRRLQRAVEGFLEASDQACARTSESEAFDEMRRKIMETDDYGLAQWSFVGQGQEEEPFCSLKHNHPHLFNELRQVVR